MAAASLAASMSRCRGFECTKKTKQKKTLVDLIRAFFQVEPGHNLLVTGPNTSGKSALFRVLGDLWPVRSGVVGKPGGLAAASQLKNVFLVPQKPYNVFGSLVRMAAIKKIVIKKGNL